MCFLKCEQTVKNGSAFFVIDVLYDLVALLELFNATWFIGKVILSENVKRRPMTLS